MTHLRAVYDSFEQIGSNDDPNQIDYKALFDAATYLVEATTFALPEDIFDLLQKKNSEEILLMPFWYRSMAYRILVAKAPQERSYLNAAISDLQLFGPLYDASVEEYRTMMPKP